MNIELKKLTNGWLVILSTPQGAMATYYPTDEAMLDAVKELIYAPLSNVVKLPRA